MRVFITGGTGLIGQRLIRRLRQRGDEVVVLSRQPDAWEQVGQDVTVITGDPTQPGLWQDKLAECDGVIHLAGTGIFAKRWDAEFQKSIRDSRVLSTKNVVDALSKAPKGANGTAKPLVSSSAIGYYGPHGDEEITEDSPPGSDFMAVGCVEWEAAARAAEAAGVRVTLIRTGIVCDPRGGALQPLMLPFKLGLGGPVGSGKHYWSWIHHVDEVGIILLALDHADAKGPINATAQIPVTNKEFAKAFGKALGRPAFMPTPPFALRLMLGEVASVICTGQRVLPKKALALGYQFQFPTVELALADLLAPAKRD